MGLRDDLKRGIDNVADSLDEAKHRTAADADKLDRKASGDAMPAGERVESAVNEAGHRVAAGVDRLKRDVRNNT